MVLFAAALVARAAKVQIIEGDEWAERAKRQHFQTSPLNAPRGEILDASGDVLVESREVARVAIAPPEVRDTVALLRALKRARIDPALVRSGIKRRRRWIDLPGLHTATDIAPIAGMRGVHVTPVMQRVYATSAGIRRIVGTLDDSGRPRDGIESSLDSVLRGDSTRVALARDRNGRAMDSPEAWDKVPLPGASIVLTINRALQDICERAISEAVAELNAAGGDIVVMNPHTGEVLALASKRSDPSAVANTAVTEPFEPGSTLKPFIAASLLARGRAKPEEIIETYNGELMIDGRLIRDLHRAPELSLSDVIRFSSNVGIVRFGERLSVAEKYETLRDLGFGMATGLPLPAESNGTLRDPRHWGKTTPQSILMGYEIAVTPIQLVTAYSAIANGGNLVEPHIVKEVRSPAGELLYRAEPRVIRRVMPAEVARSVQQMLLGVVQGGTATKADLEMFDVAGKSGTARRTVGGSYRAGNYTASFVGLFPGNDPQYVVLVKLDSPTGARFHGGDIAAPVTSVVLRAALAARDAALNRNELARVERRDPLPDASLNGPGALGAARVGQQRAAVAARREPDEGTLSYVIELPAADPAAPVVLAPRSVPDVGALGLRDAIRTLHSAGFRVRVVNSAAAGTFPVAGTVVGQGTLVQLGRPGS